MALAHATWNSLPAESPNHMTHRLQRTLCAAARLVSSTCNSTGIRHLYCTTISTGSMFQSISTTSWTLCTSLLAGKAPMYLVDCCTPVSEVAGRWQLRSASQQHLTVPPHYQLSMFARLRAFLVASPTLCNSLPARLSNPTLERIYLQVIKQTMDYINSRLTMKSTLTLGLLTRDNKQKCEHIQ